MRFSVTAAPLAAVLFLAACAPQATAPANETAAAEGDTDPMPAADPSPASLPPIPDDGGEAEPPAVDAPRESPDPNAESTALIPARFQGEWTSDPASCGTGLSDSRLRIDAERLRFHESIGTVSKVAVIGESAIDVIADYSGEGETWRNTRRLSLAPSGKNLTITGEGSTMTRIRCP